jgi:hypothetical protein
MIQTASEAGVERLLFWRGKVKEIASNRRAEGTKEMITPTDFDPECGN